MHLVVTVAVLVAVVVATSAVCRRFDLSPPLVLVALGMAGSFVPWIPDVELTSELVLVGFLPPLLYSAALQTSLVDFNANRRPILLLSVGLVAFTTVVVGAVVHAVIPGVDWPAALALGAVVAPPDAVAATAIARRIGLPRTIVTVLEGESVDLYRFTSLIMRSVDEQGRLRIVEMMWELVFADGKVNEFEESVIWRAADLLGVSSQARVELRRRAAAAHKSSVAPDPA